MTIQPLAPLTAPSGGPAEAPTSGVDAEFAALVEQNLGNQSASAQKSGNGGDPSGVSLGGAPAGKLLIGEPETEGDSSEGTGSASDVDVTTDTDTADAATLLMSTLAGVVLTDPVKSAPSDGAGSLPNESPTATTVEPAMTTTGLADTGFSGPVDLQASQPTAGVPDSGQGSADVSELTPVPEAVQTVVPVTGGAASDTSQTSGDGNGATGQSGKHAKTTSVDIASTIRGTQGSAADLGLTITAPASGTGPVTASSALTGTSAPAAPAHVPVADQVFGEVSRLVSRGDGSHRITIKLQPEALGDVRVTLSVKNGEVSVSLAADRHAHHALLEGAPELHRLLESVGAKSTDIVVKDLPSFNAKSDLLGQPGAQYGTGGREQSPDQTAGKQSGDTSARDGGTTGAAASRQPSPIDPGTRTRSTGVDVTM